MQPTFPRKNWAINTYIEFRDAKTIFEFIDYYNKPEDERDSWEKEHLEFTINHLIELFEGLKEELNQTIHTSNKITIITFFEELKQNIATWNLNIVNRDEFLKKVLLWNENYMESFIKEVDKKSEEYFSQPERIKYAHLERYKKTFFSPLHMKMVTHEEINKNFFCIEDKPKLINLEHIDKYLKILNYITDKFNEAISHELLLYDNGKIISDIDSEKSWYEKFMEKVKNNKVVAGILIGFAIYGGISQVIEFTKNIKKICLEKKA